jgi:hypothetical protein
LIHGRPLLFDNIKKIKVTNFFGMTKRSNNFESGYITVIKVDKRVDKRINKFVGNTKKEIIF